MTEGATLATGAADVEARLERLYWLMETDHLLWPANQDDDPWPVRRSLKPGVSGFRNVRTFRLGMLRITFESTPSATSRIPLEELLEIVAWLRAREPLPAIAICGSHSPISPRYPVEGSDVDLVTFAPLQQLIVDAEEWTERMRRLQRGLLQECSAVFGREIWCGVLADEFRPLPAMLDLAGLDSPGDRALWALDRPAVADLLERRWRDFEAWRRGPGWSHVASVLERHGLFGDHVARITSDPRWEDVTIFTASPRAAIHIVVADRGST